MMDEETVTHATVACAVWLVRRGHADLGREMRDEFLRESDIPAELWNEQTDLLIDYARRKGETPGVSIGHFEAVRCEEVTG